jgi:antitoxin HicB
MLEEYRLHLQVQKVENGQFLATSDVFPGLVAQGRTLSETAEIAQDVARKLIESYRDHDDPLPEGLQLLDTDMVVELDIPVGA